MFARYTNVIFPALIAAIPIVLVILSLRIWFEEERAVARGWLIAWLLPAILLILGILLAWLALSSIQERNGTLGDIETLTKILAFLAVGVFLLAKLAAGHAYSNLELTTTSSRTPIGENKDVLIVNVRIRSVGARSLQLLDVRMRSVVPGNALTDFQVEGFRKESRPESTTAEKDTILTLNPGDVIEVAGWTEVRSTAVVPVKIAVIGFASTSLAREQWTSATVSPPILDRNTRPKVSASPAPF